MPWSADGGGHVFILPEPGVRSDDNQEENSLRDQVLKKDSSSTASNLPSFFDSVFNQRLPNNNSEDENLDSKIEQHGLNSALIDQQDQQQNPFLFSSSASSMSITGRTTPSGCYEERRVKRDSTGVEEITTTKRCGDKFYGVVSKNGKVIRDYGNSTKEELDQIDMTTTVQDDEDEDDQPPVLGGDNRQSFFRKLFGV
ncbi:unnamed protein product [Didymodactylos carnosus]|uniref:Uncharacterized protein n=1 Tax=Didymodactylos carnosus TaxID=1234261 RepID=A0A813WLW6_9BILA|nr:unnamed protein product [Didymodactylos carnosus]CAF3643286.1 unnamed protein product [Didymodactylos carnosus]